jgi:nicotinate-nucleotide adenylyltransferase
MTKSIPTKKTQRVRKRIRTALYGGSFNPIHEGHLALGDFVLSKGLVEECWFVVSPKNPLKPGADSSDANIRFERVEKALEGHPGCFASNLEFNLPIPNYTVSTVRAAALNYPDREFVLLIGGDNLDVFTQWKDYTYLLEHFDILVYPRPGSSNKIPENWKRVTLLDAPQMDVSSTRIRESGL